MSAIVIIPVLMIASFKVFYDTAVVRNDIDRISDLKLVQATMDETVPHRNKFTLAFIDAAGKRLEQTVELRHGKSYCYDYFKEREGQTFAISEDKGNITSFFGSYDFDNTIETKGLVLTACQAANQKNFEDAVVNRK